MELLLLIQVTCALTRDALQSIIDDMKKKRIGHGLVRLIDKSGKPTDRLFLWREVIDDDLNEYDARDFISEKMPCELDEFEEIWCPEHDYK